MNIISSNFTNNSFNDITSGGGGLSYYTFRETRASNNISFTNRTWEGNKARNGAASNLAVWAPKPTRLLTVPTFTSYVDNLIIHFDSGVLIFNNSGTALVGQTAGFKYGCTCSDDFTQIATEASRFMINDDDAATTELYPGKSHSLSVEIMDDRMENASTMFITSLSTDESGVEIAPPYNYISNPAILLYGPPTARNSSITLFLQNSESLHNLKYVVKLLNCPIGYFFSNDTNHGCVCTAGSADKMVVRCDDQSYQAYVENFYWVGFLRNDSNLIHGHCLLPSRLLCKEQYQLSSSVISWYKY